MYFTSRFAGSGFLTKPFLKLIGRTTDDAALDQREPLCVYVDIFADGFNPYQTTTNVYWCVHGIVTRLAKRGAAFDMKSETKLAAAQIMYF